MLATSIHNNNNNKLIKNSIPCLPPTPSTSASSSDEVLDLPKLEYGSLGISTPYSDLIDTEDNSNSSSYINKTTINRSDEDDEGLYLLWTQQILKEKGFNPSPCRPETEEKACNHSKSNSGKRYDSQESLVNNSAESSVSDLSFSSDDDCIDDIEDEEDDERIDHYIAEQRKLLLSSPSFSPFHSHQPSIISRYSAITAADDDDEVSRNASYYSDNVETQNQISKFFIQLFSFCF
ncbi:MAG: hypothetical protein EXX96DRAFT_579210 [Benjaminiella poitrasii]|nr:MAG: hypothetical protein EXX96DRAFT_579210 [Benjaminiella poitrasii]